MYRVSLSYARLPDSDLDGFACGVVLSLTGNPAFPTPLVPMADLTTAQQEFHDAWLASGKGVVSTLIKNQKRATLLGLLRKEASYVQGLAGEDLVMLLSSGYGAVSTNRVSAPLEKPLLLSLDNGQAQELVLRIGPVVNARSYEVQTKNGAGWTAAGIFPQSRGIVLPGLTPGQIYSVQARAIGGSTGYSDWSEPMSHMVM